MTPAPTPEVLLDEGALADTVGRLGREIAADHPDGVVLVGVLKGALIFLADLVRAVPDIDVSVDFIAISRFAPDSGRVRTLLDLQVDVGGRDVVLVEDIVDTGLTVAHLTRRLEARAPRRLSVCTLFDRSARRIVPVPVRYRGVELTDEFVLGYGLHVHDLYRNLAVVVTADRDTLARDPAAHVRALYPRPVGWRREEEP